MLVATDAMKKDIVRLRQIEEMSVMDISKRLECSRAVVSRLCKELVPNHDEITAKHMRRKREEAAASAAVRVEEAKIIAEERAVKKANKAADKKAAKAAKLRAGL